MSDRQVFVLLALLALGYVSIFVAWAVRQDGSGNGWAQGSVAVLLVAIEG